MRYGDRQPAKAKLGIYKMLIYITAVTLVLLFCNYGTAFGESSSKSSTSSHVFYNGSRASNQVALTFDDGPDNNYTLQILDILKQYNVKATFFLIGYRAKAHPDVIKRIVSEGHVIGNHTWDHHNFTSLSEKDVLSEVSKADDEIFNITGLHTLLFRPPYGNITTRQKADLVSKGYNIIQWSVDTRDWAGTSVSGIMSNVKSEVHPGGIILQHCFGSLSNTVKALPQIIKYLQDKGYSLVTVPELLNVPATSVDETHTPLPTPTPVLEIKYLNDSKAQKLDSMGLYDGISTDKFNPDLGASLNRESGVAFILNMIGKKADVLALTNDDVNAVLSIFKDADKISPWARNYVAYAVKTGLSNGISADQFGPAITLDANMFCSIILRGLGYNITNIEIAIPMLKDVKGLSDDEVKALTGKTTFIKDDAVGIAYDALNALDLSGKKLIDNLISSNIVTQAQANDSGYAPAADITPPVVGP